MVTLDKIRIRRYCLIALVSGALLVPSLARALAQQSPAETLFRNVRVLDVINGRLGPPTNVVVPRQYHRRHWIVCQRGFRRQDH